MPNPIPAMSPKAYYQNGVGLWQDTAGTIPCVVDGDPVARWDDQSGLGYHMLQATADNRPTYLADAGPSFKNLPGVAFNTSAHQQYLQVDHFPFSSGATTSTMMVAFKPADASCGGLGLMATKYGQPSLDVGRLYFFGATGAAYLPSTAGQVAACVYDGSQSTDAARLKLWRNKVQLTLSTFSVLTAGFVSTPTPFYLGRDGNADGLALRGVISEAAFFSEALADADREAVTDYWGARFFASTRKTLFCGGDSRTAGAPDNYNNTLPLTGHDSYPLHLQSLLGTDWDLVNAGTNGQSWAGAINADRTAIDNLQDDWQARQAVLAWFSANDFLDRSTATVEADATAYFQDRLLAGFHAGDVYCGVDPWETNSASQAKIPVYAAWLRAGNLPAGVGLVDFQADPQFDSYADCGPPLYVDGVHFTDAGNAALAAIAAPILQPPTNANPDTPTISAGTPSTTGVTLTGSTFSDPDSDAHAASQWQVTTTADTGYAATVISTGDDATHLTSYAATGLTAATAYRARVRYKDSAGNYSAWATSATFTTASVPLAAGTASFVSSGTAGIIASATAPSDGSGSGPTYQWERNANGGSYADLSGKTSLSLTDATGTAGNLYGYRCKQTRGAETVTTNAVTAQAYAGGAIGSGGISRSRIMGGG